MGCGGTIIDFTFETAGTILDQPIAYQIFCSCAAAPAASGTSVTLYLLLAGRGDPINGALKATPMNSTS